MNHNDNKSTRESLLHVPATGQNFLHANVGARKSLDPHLDKSFHLPILPTPDSRTHIADRKSWCPFQSTARLSISFGEHVTLVFSWPQSSVCGFFFCVVGEKEPKSVILGKDNAGHKGKYHTDAGLRAVVKSSPRQVRNIYLWL